MGSLLAHASILVNGSLYHYNRRDHALEKRVTFRDPLNRIFHCDDDHLAIFLTTRCRSVRGYRSCHLDLGFAASALVASARSLGWQTRRLAHLADDSVRHLIGNDTDPALAILITPDVRFFESTLNVTVVCDRDTETEDTVLTVRGLRKETFGRLLLPNDDDPKKMDPHIVGINAATEKPETNYCPRRTRRSGRNLEPYVHVARRSRMATTFDPYSDPLGSFEFQRLLDAMDDSDDIFDDAGVSALVLFVHRVADLAPGVYVLVRNLWRKEATMEALQSRIAGGNATWTPGAFGLVALLAPADVRQLAARLSGDDAASADGYVTIALLADFAPVFFRPTPWRYRQLLWEAGALVHRLAIAATRLSLSWTRGFFNDDDVHDLLGFSDHRFQVIAHVAIGRSHDDVPDPYLLLRGFPPEFSSGQQHHHNPTTTTTVHIDDDDLNLGILPNTSQRRRRPENRTDERRNGSCDAAKDVTTPRRTPPRMVVHTTTN